MAYPTNYEAVPRWKVLATKPSPDIAVLLIHGNVATDLDVPDTYEKARIHVPKFGSYLFIGLDDVNRQNLDDDDIAKYHPYFATKDKVKTIDAFLQANADKRVLISCIAGISRSGSVQWYLDQRNHRVNDWTYKINECGEKYPLSEKYFPLNDLYHLFNDLLQESESNND